MTKETAQKLLNEASNIIFQVEFAICDIDSPVRKVGYRARIELGNFQNAIKYNCSEEDINAEV